MKGSPRLALTIALVAVFSLAFAMPAAAADVRGGDTITVAASETVNDDLYAFGQTITILGRVNGDVIAAGNTIEISGPVSGSVMAAGNSISIRGPVNGSVRVAGNAISIDAGVSGDVLAAGNTVMVASSAKVGRDLALGAADATVSGSIGRDVRGGSTKLVIDTTVGRDVNVDVESLRLTSRAVVAGNLSYGSANEATIEQGATVRGTTQRREPRVQTQPVSPTPANRLIEWLRNLVGLVILGLLLLWLAPGFVRRATDRAESNPASSLGLGVVVLIGVPILAILAFVVGAIIGGWWIGLIAIALYFVAFAVGIEIAAFAIGEWIVARIGRPHDLAIGLVVGALLLTLVGIVPILGGLIGFLALLVGMGAIALSLGGTREPGGPTEPVAAR